MEFSRRGLLGAGMARLIDPVEHVVRTGDEELGYVPQREMVRRQDQQARIDAQSDRTQRFIVFETIQTFYPNVPANADTVMQMMIATGTGTFSLSSANPDLSMQGRLVAFRVMSNGNVTAGTITPLFYVLENGDLTTHVISECELSASEPNTKSVIWDWPNAIQFSKNSTWDVGLRADAAYAPTTLDFTAWVTFGYEQWVPS